jgi:energy-coupling factor transport system ATP-binding protein
MIDLRDIRVRYPGAGMDALAGVSLTIAPGSRTAIMGANGSGKTTLVHVMAGLRAPTQGTVERRGRVGMVMQNPFLQITSLTVERELACGLQNLQIPAPEIHARVGAVLDACGLARLRDRAPSRLSGGEMQRLALAAVLITEPDVLILDEATSLLSPASRSDLLRRVEDASRRRPLTIILVTQFPAEAGWCPDLVVLRQGAIAMHAAPQEIFADPCAVAGLGLPVPPRLALGAP